jgi:hypothetical protein
MSLKTLADYLAGKWLFITAAKNKAPEAPKSAPFGEFAWAGKREGMPEEADTELEKSVYHDLKSHFASKHVGLPKLTVKILMKILKAGWYKPVLHPPPHKKLFRGLKLNHEQLSKLLGEDDFDDEGSVELNDAVPVDNGYSSSWTFKKKISTDFAGNYGKAKRGFEVYLTADVDDNEHRFLAGPGGLYDVDGLSRWHLEKETVGLEPIKVKTIEWKSL